MIALWAAYALAELPDGDPARSKELEKAAMEPGENGELAKYLVTALPANEIKREPTLDDATTWMRHHHPQAAKIWQDWDVAEGRLVRRKAP